MDEIDGFSLRVNASSLTCLISRGLSFPATVQNNITHMLNISLLLLKTILMYQQEQAASIKSVLYIYKETSPKIFCK